MRYVNAKAANVVFEALFTQKLGSKVFAKGDTVMFFKSCTIATEEVTSEVREVRGGPDNNVLMSIDGQKGFTFTFSEAVLSSEAIAILSGADLIPARNKLLHGASPDAEPVISPHIDESIAITVANIGDPDVDNHGKKFDALATYTGGPALPARGGLWNVPLTNRPYIGQNASISVFLQDSDGEVGDSVEIPIRLIPNGQGQYADYYAAQPEGGIGAPPGYDDVQISIVGGVISYLRNPGSLVTNSGSKQLVLDVFPTPVAVSGTTASYEGLKFVAFDSRMLPMPATFAATNAPLTSAKFQRWPHPNATTVPPEYTGLTLQEQNAYFDDHVKHYVALEDLCADPTAAEPAPNVATWSPGWGALSDYIRQINVGDLVTNGLPLTKNWAVSGYCYLIAPPDGIGDPRARKEGSSITYRVNVPSILYQDIVEVKYQIEDKHDAVAIDILPNKFAGTYYVEAYTLATRKSDNLEFPQIIVIPKLKINTAISISLSSTDDPTPLEFTGTALPAPTKYNPAKKVLAQIINRTLNDNYDGDSGIGNPTTDYRRYQYNENMDGVYIWGDAALEVHSNIDWSDIPEAGSETNTTVAFDGHNGFPSVPNFNVEQKFAGE